MEANKAVTEKGSSATDEHFKDPLLIHTSASQNTKHKHPMFVAVQIIHITRDDDDEGY